MTRYILYSIISEKKEEDSKGFGLGSSNDLGNN